MLVKVTQEHISSSECADPNKCAVATALQEVVNSVRPGLIVSVISSDYIDLYTKDFEDAGSVKIKTDHQIAVDKFIHEFDTERNPDPIQFECEIIFYDNVDES